MYGRIRTNEELRYACDYESTHSRVEEWNNDYKSDCWYKSVQSAYAESRNYE